VCLGAAVALAAAPAAVRLLGARGLPRAAVLWAAWAAPRGALAAAAALSLLRAAALVAHYGAPMAVYRRLPEVRRRREQPSVHPWQTMVAGCSRGTLHGAASPWPCPACCCRRLCFSIARPCWLRLTLAAARAAAGRRQRDLRVRRR